MKKKLAIVIIIICGTFLFFSCNLFNAVSVEERIIQFVSDCNNSDKSNMYLNFHPDMGDYSIRKADTTWSEFNSVHATWVITILTNTGSSTKTVTGTINNKNLGAAEAITILFKEDEPDVWLITSFSWPANGGLLID